MRIIDKILELVESTITPLHGANLRIVFLSLLTATIFWFFNALNKEYTAKINYPVEIIYGRDSLVAVNELPKHIPVNVYTDSQYSIGVLTNETWNPKKNKELIKEIKDLINTFSGVSFEWVKGHSNNIGNEAADKLAVQAYTTRKDFSKYYK